MEWSKTPERIGKILRRFQSVITRLVDATLLWISLAALLLSLYDMGFSSTPEMERRMFLAYIVFIAIFFVALLFRNALIFLNRSFSVKENWAQFGLMVMAFLFLLGVIFLPDFFKAYNAETDTVFTNALLYVIILLVFIEEISNRSANVLQVTNSPALIFALSFAFIIFIGALLLMLPNATAEVMSTTGKRITFTDALFTATSAVCVTGLIVADTATDFTRLGQVIIMLLIQIGGLGIMTFTNFFALFFKGASSFQNQLMVKDMINVEQIGEVFKTLIKIIVVTFSIEIIGALLIFFSSNPAAFTSFGERLFFALFHSVSAFCNAGFSTYTNGLYEEPIRHNYNIHLIVAVLIILGGIGFSILFDYYTYLKNIVKDKVYRLLKSERYHYVHPIISLNTKIVVYTTLFLLVFGAVLFAVFEYNHSLTEHEGWWGKLVTSVFGSVTPRTAGFNSVNMGLLSSPTIMIYLLLMWIGASPGSTGGGIKTTTFAIGTLNFVSVARGKEQIEIGWKEIPAEAVRRAFAIIALSLIAIGFSVFFVTFFEENNQSILTVNNNETLVNIAFECFSAFSTVGLSLGITAKLTAASKIVLIVTMFIGRVGMLTLLIGMVNVLTTKNGKTNLYRYPKEEIFIS
ncbi:MAG TPA: potassium transporter TrkG [Chitinophagales bacterium]|nr:potassium transporter TrkG [Chitinophagales bacterium]HRK25868.1 potassium transporter TrkG [Chitinophagales bacterium]